MEGIELKKITLSDMQNLRTLTADYIFSLLNKENLMQPIQMQLSKEQKTFFKFIFLIFEI